MSGVTAYCEKGTKFSEKSIFLANHVLLIATAEQLFCSREIETAKMEHGYIKKYIFDLV